MLMARRVEIDEALLEEAQRLGAHGSAQQTVHQALREYVERRRQQSILALFGTVEFDPSYDAKHQRRRR